MHLKYKNTQISLSFQQQQKWAPQRIQTALMCSKSVLCSLEYTKHIMALLLLQQDLLTLIYNPMNKKGNKIPQIISWDDLIKIKQEQFFRDLKELRKFIKLWRELKVNTKQQTNQSDTLLQYAIYLEQANNLDRAKSSFFIKSLNYQKEVQNAETQKQVFLGTKFIDQKKWRVDFSLSFIEHLKHISEKSIIDIFIKLYILAEGYLLFKRGKQLSLSPWEAQTNLNLKLFQLSIDINGKNSFLLLSIGVQKFPHFDFGNNQMQIKGFDYFLAIRCEQIISQEQCFNEKLIRTLLERIETETEENPRLKFRKQQLLIDQASIIPKQLYYHQKKGDNNDKPTILSPTPFQIYVPKDIIQVEQFQFGLSRYFQFRNRVNYKRLNKQQRSLNCEQQKNQSQQFDELEIQTQRNQVIQFNGHSKILQNLKKIPNFKYQLVSQQRQVLCKQGNLIIVGRSGTGKTTCAMLRLYGIQFMIKTGQYNNLRRQGLIDPKQQCLIMFQQANQFTKNIFLTFSHVLIDEIRKQYDDMIYQIKQKHSEKCEMCKKTLKINRRQEQEDPLDRLKRQEEQQEKRVISLNDIQSNDYPGFFTVEKFIRIIDKTITRPFFCHQKNKQKENGKNIIKKSYINRYNYGPEKIVNTDTVQCTFVDYDFFFNHIWIDLPKELTKTSKQFCLLTPSIIWSEIFSILKGSLKSHLCPEGFISLKMYLDDHMSIFQRQQEKVRQYKQKAYKIMKSYINWCKTQHAYDLMDVVNHILKQIQFYEYSGPKINYMFIDQVQDLTASTTFLISKMVINNVFYCGDTAQAITKGVSFRFQDLKFLFNREYFKSALVLQPPQDIINLTVNFRSHNFILQLANFIVATIEGIFPKSINRLKQQKSNLCGPKPYLILNQHYSILFDLLCGGNPEDNEEEEKEVDLEQSISQVVKTQQRKIFLKAERKKKKILRAQKKQEQEDNQENFMNDVQSDDQYIQRRQFNSQQVIIVRNLQQKKKLPKHLKKGIVFTPQSAKGLEYDCVILYNFFGSCPIYQKWGSILEHLESYYSYQTVEQFQKDITRREKQQNQQLQEKPLPNETKLQLGFDKNLGKYKVWNIRVKQSIKGVSTNLFHELATELKILYTVITRARSVFIIYDKRIPNQFYKLWKQMMLVEQSNWDNVEEQYKVVKDYVQVKQKHKKYINDDAKWFHQGSNMLARKDFDNAKKCFLNINRFDIVERIQAYQLQIKAQNQLYRIAANQKNLLKFGRDDRKIAKIRLQKEKKNVLMQYSQAGKKYLKNKRFKEAAQAFQKGQNFQQALSCYKQIDNPQKVGYCCKRLKRYKQAIDIFKRYNDIEGLIGCFIQLKSWKELFELLTQNSINIAQIQGINDISAKCVKQMLSSLMNSPRILNAIQYYSNFYGKSNQKQKDKKRVYNQNELSIQMGKVFLEHQYLFMKKLLSKLIQKAKNFKEIQERYLHLQAKIGMLLDQQAELSTKISELQKKQYKNLNQQQDCLIQLLNYQQKYNQQQLESMPNYLEKKRQKEQLTLNKIQIVHELKQAKDQLSNIHEELNQEQPAFDKIKIQYQNVQKNYDHSFISKGIELTNKKLKITMSNFITLNKRPENTLNKVSNKKQPTINLEQADIISMSDFSQMTQMWDCEEGSIGGIRLMPNDSHYLIEQIEKILKFSQSILNLKVEQTYKPYHHRFIHQKLMRYLVENVSSEQYYTVQILRKCDLVEQNMISLAVCNYKPEFVCLAPKYIAGYCLNYSSNFKQYRHFWQELEQIIEDQSNQNEDEDKAEVQHKSQIQQFLLTLKQDGLQHKIPRLSFPNKYYYQTLASQIIYSLLLQGFYKQALLLCNPNIGCRLAYMYSSYEKLVSYIKEIAQKLGINKLLDRQFLFTEDERILSYYPQAKVVNIFSMQNIVYAFDQCQSNPFLSKKRTTDDIDIPEHVVRYYYEVQSNLQIKNAKNQRILILNKIRGYQEQNKQYEACKRDQILNKQVAERLYQQSVRQSHIRIQNEQSQIQILEMEQQELDTRKSNLQYVQNLSRIPVGEKRRYQNQLHRLIFQIKALPQNSDEAKRLERRRMDLDEQYKQKRRIESQSFQNLQKVKVRIQNKQKEIRYKRQIIRKCNDIIQYQTQQINSMTRQAIQQHYLNLIRQNNNKISQLRKSIPEWLNLDDETQMIQAVVRELIRGQKNSILEDNLDKMRKKNMNNIKKSSNIPQNQHYKFLSLYIQDQFSLDNIDNSKKYLQTKIVIFKIFTNSTSLQKILADQKTLQQQNVNDLKICNIVIMYLNILFSKSFRQTINQIIQKQTYNYNDNKQKRQSINQDLRRACEQVHFYQMKINQLRQIQGINDKRHPRNRELNNAIYHKGLAETNKRQYQIMKREVQQFEYNPTAQYLNFLNSIYIKIKNLDSSQVRFIDILFGFFQCRVIRQCAPLCFIQSQYVLAKSNSIVIQRLKKQRRKCFAYRFDQENETILCRFEDIQRIILGIIEGKHLQIYNINPNLNEKDIRNKDKKKFIDRQTLGYTKFTESDQKQNQMILKLTISDMRWDHRDKVKNIFNLNFKAPDFMIEVKAAKREALEFLLEKKHEKSEDFFFASHQIREYQFVEKTLFKMSNFNYDLLYELKQKFEGLRNEWQNYFKIEPLKANKKL